MTYDDESKKTALTVKKLITLLKKAHPDLPVSMEGCDCDGWAGSVTIEPDEGGKLYVYIRRSHPQ